MNLNSFDDKRAIASPSLQKSGAAARPKLLHRWLALLVVCAIEASVPAHAHGGQIEVGSAGPKGPVELSAAQQKAIGLALAPAMPAPLATELSLNGEIQLMPNRQADVSLRISGQVTQVSAQVGDTVHLGQRLAVVQSRLVGDPPPSLAITAPMSGLIDTRNVVLGQAVEPNTVLFHISDRSQVLFAGKVYEADLGKVKIGQEVRVKVLSYPDQVFTGRLMRIDANLDAASRTVQVWVALRNPKALLKPNMNARGNVVIARNDAALTVPNAAILEAGGEKFVFVREGRKFHRVDVTLGAKDDQHSEITDGLVPGDEVVVQGARQVYTQWLMGGRAMTAHE